MNARTPTGPGPAKDPSGNISVRGFKLAKPDRSAIAIQHPAPPARGDKPTNVATSRRLPKRVRRQFPDFRPAASIYLDPPAIRIEGFRRAVRRGGSARRMCCLKQGVEARPPANSKSGARGHGRPTALIRLRTAVPGKHQWGEQDSNLRRREPTDLQSVPFDRFGIPPKPVSGPNRRAACAGGPGCLPGRDPDTSRASGGTRTHDQRFTKPLLYQLSYAGGGRNGKPGSLLESAWLTSGTDRRCGSGVHFTVIHHPPVSHALFQNPSCNPLRVNSARPNEPRSRFGLCGRRSGFAVQGDGPVQPPQLNQRL
jgi:hypothetical protein